MKGSNNAQTMKRKRSDSSPPKKKRKVAPVTAIDKQIVRRLSKIEAAAEWKYSDTFLGTTLIPWEGAAPTSWVLQCLNTSTLGTAQNNQRVGTQVDNKRLDVRISLRTQPLNIGDCRIRVTFFWMKNSNSASPTVPQLFDGTLISGSTYNFYNDTYKDTYKIIWDKLFELQPLDWNGTTTTIGDQESLNKSFRLSRRSRYVTGVGAGTYVDILDNALYMAVSTSANSGVAGVNNPVIDMSTRCWYTDS